jgi:hypothetical protein
VARDYGLVSRLGKPYAPIFNAGDTVVPEGLAVIKIKQVYSAIVLLSMIVGLLTNGVPGFIGGIFIGLLVLGPLVAFIIWLVANFFDLKVDWSWD